MPKSLRVALPLLLLVVVYCGDWLVSQLLPDSSDTVFIIWISLILLAGGANIVRVILDKGEGSPRRLAFWGMLLKLCLVPFYLLVFVGGSAISLAMMTVPGAIFGLPFLVAILGAIDYILLLITSSYGIASAVRASTQGLIPIKGAVKTIVLHFIFVTDVLDAIALYLTLRKCDAAVLEG